MRRTKSLLLFTLLLAACDKPSTATGGGPGTLDFSDIVSFPLPDDSRLAIVSRARIDGEFYAVVLLAGTEGLGSDISPINMRGKQSYVYVSGETCVIPKPGVFMVRDLDGTKSLHEVSDLDDLPPRVKTQLMDKPN